MLSKYRFSVTHIALKGLTKMPQNSGLLAFRCERWDPASRVVVPWPLIPVPPILPLGTGPPPSLTRGPTLHFV